MQRAALPFAVGAALTLTSALAAQQDTPPQQAPAPVVRVRPRPQTPSTNNAPADAAPLVARPPRPHPINPQAFGEAVAPSGQTTTTAPARPRPATVPRAPATSPNAAPGLAQSASATDHPAAPRSTPSSVLNRNLIVLDPAHGAQDSGSRIGDNLVEKDVTLAFAFRLRSLLTARGFTVVLTRENDAATQPNTANTPLTLDDRAGIANHARAAACLLLHATARGTGVHLYSSELDPAPGEAVLQPWLTAQAPWVPASRQLEHSVSSALGRSRISLVSSTASVRPVDSLTCPALVVELAPETTDPRTISDGGYQERVASAIAGALVFWQNQVQTPPRLTTTPAPKHTPSHHRPATPTTTEEPQP